MAMARAPAGTPREQLVRIGVQDVQRTRRALMRACEPAMRARLRLAIESGGVVIS